MHISHTIHARGTRGSYYGDITTYKDVTYDLAGWVLSSGTEEFYGELREEAERLGNHRLSLYIQHRAYREHGHAV